jgi:hypothetical protein
MKLGGLEAEVERMENLLAEGIHTCNPTCKRPLCVLRRENKALREALVDALDGYQECAPYKGDYLYNKHGDAKEIARLQKALGGE